MAKIALNGIRYGTFEAPRSTTERRIRWRNPEIKIPLLMVSPPASRYLLSKEGALSDLFQPEQIFLSYSRTVPPARSGGLRDDTEGHRLGSFGTRGSEFSSSRFFQTAGSPISLGSALRRDNIPLSPQDGRWELVAFATAEKALKAADHAGARLGLLGHPGAGLSDHQPRRWPTTRR